MAKKPTIKAAKKAVAKPVKLKMDASKQPIKISDVLIINGPNLNMLGKRQPEIYGTLSLADIQKKCETKAKSLKLKMDFIQSNSETEIVEEIHRAASTTKAIIINAAAYTHTSVAILDALLATGLPVVEVHISNIYKREEFRHKSFISKASVGVICGFGANSYTLALEAVKEII